MDGSGANTPRGGPKRHTRNISSSKTSAQRTYLGEGEFDPLAVEASLPERPARSPARSPQPAAQEDATEASKDFSHLVRSGNFQPLSYDDVPAPFRDPDLSHLGSSPSPSTLVKAGYFRAAAVEAVRLLTSIPSPPPEEMFDLLYIRLASLTLINQSLLAAQESRCLQDLSSPFYLTNDQPRQNILPWELRVLATRLQGLSISDAKKVVMGYYDLARDARKALAEATESEEQELWRTRLVDLGIRVANALVEMGDYNTAIRHLQTLDVESAPDKDRRLVRGRLGLLYLRIGRLDAARECIVAEAESDQSSYADALRPLLSAAEGNYGSAAAQLKASAEASSEADALAMINLAVMSLYTGDLPKSRELLEKVLETGNRYPTLLFNLATVFELCSEKARTLKMDLAEKVAKQQDELGYERAAVDFKF